MLADRIAADNGWPVVAGCLRGIGPSTGDFSLGGWYDDLRTLVDHAAELGNGGGVWIVGFGTGGALALCVAGEDSRVRGVACFGSPATFADWANDGVGMIEYARRVGAIRSPGFPTRPTPVGGRIHRAPTRCLGHQVAPRPVLVVHGADDEEVPVADGRRLAESAGPGPNSVSWRARAIASAPIPELWPCWRGGSNVRGPEQRSRRAGRSTPGAALAASFGSSDSVRKRTTTKRRAPAAASAGTVSGVTPPVTNTGRPARATAKET